MSLKQDHTVLAFFVLAILGFVITWYYNLQYLMQGGGLVPSEFFVAAFANSLTTAITIDVYLSAIVFSAWVISDSRQSQLKWPWVYILVCFSIGLAVAFPLYLAFRELAKIKTCSTKP
ncbi:DUF2834 domain-containing protein [Aquitalea aquatica]|uniref:DUF2834 domain-containing protein n=1 Tax=Aquitalea aquatica TaxID=3044273 RepID=A0A838XUI7_9NEIS|nr:DUF2834 domain-containing protein [Aquitalea magnusonii]MBA4706790.1 DUF2834 domain-containing protein [Aquitalea magnusonii]